MRVGINTGPVVVGVVGTDSAHEYTAMGDTVNVAARMQGSARPGSVLVTSATYRFITPLVDAVDVGPLELDPAARAGYDRMLGIEAEAPAMDAPLWAEDEDEDEDEGVGEEGAASAACGGRACSGGVVVA